MLNLIYFLLVFPFMLLFILGFMTYGLTQLGRSPSNKTIPSSASVVTPLTSVKTL